MLTYHILQTAAAQHRSSSVRSFALCRACSRACSPSSCSSVIASDARCGLASASAAASLVSNSVICDLSFVDQYCKLPTLMIPGIRPYARCQGDRRPHVDLGGVAGLVGGGRGGGGCRHSGGATRRSAPYPSPPREGLSYQWRGPARGPSVLSAGAPREHRHRAGPR